MLRKQTKRRIFDIARNHHRWQTADLEGISVDSKLLENTKLNRKRIIKRNVKDQIKKEFGSGIITSLLLSLALKLAMKWIEQWMEDNLFGYNTPISVEDMKNDK